ncbi:MAG: hypothetical protein WC132_05635, partial [Methanomethylophilus sp.]
MFGKNAGSYNFEQFTDPHPFISTGTAEKKKKTVCSHERGLFAGFVIAEIMKDFIIIDKSNNFFR